MAGLQLAGFQLAGLQLADLQWAGLQQAGFLLPGPYTDWILCWLVSQLAGSSTYYPLPNKRTSLLSI